MLSESDRVELLALQRRAYAASGAPLTSAEQSRLRELRERSRPVVVASAGDGDGVPTAGTRTPAAQDANGVPRHESDVETWLEQFTAPDGTTPENTTEPTAEVATGPTPTARSRRRPALIIAAAVAAIGLFVGGWFAGQVTSRTGAPSEPLASLIADAQDAEAWDPGSFRLVGYIDNTVYAGGTIEDGALVCVTAQGQSTFSTPCQQASPGTVFLLGGQSIVQQDGSSADWNYTATWDGTSLTALQSDVSVSNGEPAFAVIDGEFTPYMPDLETVRTTVDWNGTAWLLASFGPAKIWAGVSTADEVCVVVTGNAAQSQTCAERSALPMDISPLVTDVVPDYSWLRVTLSEPQTPGVSPYRVDILPAG